VPSGMDVNGSSLCRSTTSSTPAMARRVARRGGSSASASPMGLCLSRPPRVGSWRGPLPHRRVTPLPVLGLLLDAAAAAHSPKCPTVASSPSSPAAAAVSSSPSITRTAETRDDPPVDSAIVGLHACAGPVREDVDLAVPFGWTHLRRRRRRVPRLLRI
jgi:hypothetical protein